MAIPRDQWEWFGKAGHFICGRWCRFHLCTLVGDYLVSTVGEYVHPRRSRGSEQREAEWLAENWPGEKIGADRLYETMVFTAGERCTSEGCDCGQPTPLDASEPHELRGYNSAHAATQGHMELCEKWAKAPNNERATQ